MENQVTSIEQSKRLIELGVPAEKASMVWEMDEDCARLKIWNTDKETRRVLHNKYPNYYVPAFTVADLLAVLPKTIWGDQMEVERWKRRDNIRRGIQRGGMGCALHNIPRIVRDHRLAGDSQIRQDYDESII